jgi:hypothetical protein
LKRRNNLMGAAAVVRTTTSLYVGRSGRWCRCCRPSLTREHPCCTGDHLHGMKWIISFLISAKCEFLNIWSVFVSRSSDTSCPIRHSVNLLNQAKWSTVVILTESDICNSSLCTKSNYYLSCFSAVGDMLSWIYTCTRTRTRHLASSITSVCLKIKRVVYLQQSTYAHCTCMLYANLMSCIILSRLALWTLGCIHNLTSARRATAKSSALLTNPSL